MRPRCRLPRRSWRLEHNQCRSLLYLPAHASAKKRPNQQGTATSPSHRAEVFGTVEGDGKATRDGEDAVLGDNDLNYEEVHEANPERRTHLKSPLCLAGHAFEFVN